MKIKKLFLVVGLLVFNSLLPAFAYTEIANKEELRQRLGSLSPSTDLSHIKVAILDNGFEGFIPNKGMLPDSAELIEGPLRIPSRSSHGLGMAQILWTITGQSANGPKIYLVNSNGFTNFKAAVDFVVNNNVDIVLYSQVWLLGGNFDGKGFINKVVNKATDKGVIWINAAGKLGGHVYSGGVTGSLMKFRLQNKLDENNFTVTLVWNDFTNNESDCTSKDLNLEILDLNNNVVQVSELIQQGQAPDLRNPADTRSCHARESISVKALERGEYQIRVVAKTTNFGSQDKFKVMISDDRPESLEFTDHTVGYEILPPADNENVITVGDQSSLSSVGPTSDGRIKPDFLIANTKVSFTNGNLTFGSSNAAAMLAGSLATIMSHKSGITSKALFSYAQSLRQSYAIPGGLVTAPVPYWIQNYVPAGGLVRFHPTTGRAIIFSKEAPLSLPQISRFNLRLIRHDDIVACDEFLVSCGLYPQTQDLYLRPPLVEFRQYLKGSNGGRPGVWSDSQQILDILK